MNSIKYIILDFGKVLAYPTTGHWFITPKFMELVDMSKIDLMQFNECTKKLNDILSRKLLIEKKSMNCFLIFIVGYLIYWSIPINLKS